jgi:hypothetical protein
MRGLTDRESVLAFMRRLGRSARSDTRVYLTGGASALLLEWRMSTVDIDIRIEPDTGDVLKAIPEIKEELHVNVELAAPDDFIPPLPGWRERSRFIAREGRIDFYHYDFYAQALAKIERSHGRDINDVSAMIRLGLIEPSQLLHFFEKIEPEMYRYPAIDPRSFRRAVEVVSRRNS